MRIAPLIALTALSVAALGQTGVFVEDEGVTSEIHRSNLGRIVFTPKAEAASESDFLKTFEFKETGDLAIRAPFSAPASSAAR